MKTKDFFDKWLTKYVYNTVKLRTYNKYNLNLVNYIYPFLGEIQIENITKETIIDFIDKLINNPEKKLSTNTIIGIIQTLNQGFNFALELKYISLNPIKGIKLPKIKEKEVIAINRKEQRKIEEYCLNHKKSNYIGIVLCLYTGIRIGELLALTWKDIDFKQHLVYIKRTSYYAKKDNKYKVMIDTPKTIKSTRIIPLNKNLSSLLYSRYKMSKSEFVITTKDNKMVDVRSYQRTFQSVLSKCKIEKYNFHSLRHTFATRAIELGVDVKTISDILGHSTVNITLNRYAHSLLEHKKSEMDKLSRLLCCVK